MEMGYIHGSLYNCAGMGIIIHHFPDWNAFRVLTKKITAALYFCHLFITFVGNNKQVNDENSCCRG